MAPHQVTNDHTSTTNASTTRGRSQRVSRLRMGRRAFTHMSHDERQAFHLLERESAPVTDSDSDGDTTPGRAAGGERLLMRAWFMRQVASGDIPELVWHDDEKTMIRIPWVHGSRQTWDKNRDSELFRRWAEYTGRYDSRRPDAKKWKANFRCALNSLPDVREMKHLRKKGQRAYKVYHLDEPKRKNSVISRSRCPSRQSQPPHSPMQRTQQAPSPIPAIGRMLSPEEALQQTTLANTPQSVLDQVQGPVDHAVQELQDMPMTNSPACSVQHLPSEPFYTGVQQQNSTDHAYAHNLLPTINDITLPEPVLQLANEPVEMTDELCSPPDSCTPDHMSYTDNDYKTVTNYLLSRSPEQIAGETDLTELAVLRPVIYSATNCTYNSQMVMSS